MACTNQGVTHTHINVRIIWLRSVTCRWHAKLIKTVTGWAYDLRSVSTDMIRKRAERTGDGSLKDGDDPNHHMNSVWGWGDPDISSFDKESCITLHPERKHY